VVKNLMLFLFLFMTVLYYFLRFQWGWDNYIIGFQVGLLSVFSLIGFINLLVNSHFYKNYEAVYVIIFIYCAFLLFITFFRGGVHGVSYGIKDYVLPVSLLLFYPIFILREDIDKIFLMVAIIASFVSIIYLGEFISKNILMSGYFHYTGGMRELTGSIGETKVGYDEYSYFRLAGPISHNNSTGLMIAIGALSSMALSKTKYSKYSKTLLLVNIVVLILTGARTAWLSFLVGYLFMNKISIIKLFIYSVAGIFLVNMVLTLLPGFSSLIELEGILKTFYIILSQVEVLDLSRLYNIIVGSGYNYNGMLDRNSFFHPILQDDMFFIQLSTVFGLIPILLFIYFIFSNKNLIKNIKYDVQYRASSAILLTFFISTLHTNALVRPQLFPLFFLFVVILHKIKTKYLLGKAPLNRR